MTHPIDRPLEVAAFRYRLIAAAVEAEGEGVLAAIQEAAGQAHWNPWGREVRVSLASLWKWLAAYRQGGLRALQPKPRKDKGLLQAFPQAVLDTAQRLRREKPSRSTRTILDILVRKGLVHRGELARSTLDRHLAQAGLSRKLLRTLGKATFRQIETTAPFALLVGDFHDGPYVRVGLDNQARRSMFGGFIDHYSRFIVEGRYYLTEDFVALRFGFRRLLAVHGLPEKIFLDNGAAFRATRFHAGCEAMGIKLVHSKPYVAESRGAIERWNRTLKEQFESDVRGREVLPSLDELNAWFEAWLVERYHQDVHSETGQSPAERFGPEAAGRPAPAMELVEESLRLREIRTVQRKWSVVEVQGIRFSVTPALRGRKVQVLYDPSDLSYVLIAYDGRTVERAFPLKPGVIPPPPPDLPKPDGEPTDYLALLQRDHERRVRRELSALRLQAPPALELDLPELTVLLEACRDAPLSDAERSEAAALWRRLRPLVPEEAHRVLDGTRRRLGPALHLSVYLQALETQVVRNRVAKSRAVQPKGDQP